MLALLKNRDLKKSESSLNVPKFKGKSGLSEAYDITLISLLYYLSYYQTDNRQQKIINMI